MSKLSSGAACVLLFTLAAGAYAVDVDARVGATAVRRRETLTVQRRTFATRRLRVDPDFVNPPESLLARIESEATQATTRRETLGPTAMLKARPISGVSRSQIVSPVIRIASRELLTGHFSIASIKPDGNLT